MKHCQTTSNSWKKNQIILRSQRDNENIIQMTVVSSCSLQAVEAIISLLSFFFYSKNKKKKTKIKKIFPCFLCLMNYAIETGMSFKEATFSFVQIYSNWTNTKQTNRQTNHSFVHNPLASHIACDTFGTASTLNQTFHFQIYLCRRKPKARFQFQSQTMWFQSKI